MTRDEIIARLKAVEPDVRARGVAALYVYGSHARDEARQDSDIDLLVEFEPGRGIGFLDYMAPYVVLDEQFPGIEIGYSTRDALVSTFRPEIERTAIRVF
ncbi:MULTISPECIES: nucleotidyltransferase family protein [unclassified Aureimonas]|uniref:nucleotidyltransferase family protein n=1 Tax=unclassified Aureimonas TaxID=2615206 RepID=UPI0006F1F0B4|nr:MULTISPECIES: nucleotidyltransferase domain-containing protein [unclassified Aureimonas]KQT65764.1 DNA polymerase III subunit beta [Aureimonas sp. Leaf427]KQT74764.1 DNA polymerase III subunit beta [Aureimonas sp. Leaf460]